MNSNVKYSQPEWLVKYNVAAPVFATPSYDFLGGGMLVPGEDVESVNHKVYQERNEVQGSDVEGQKYHGEHWHWNINEEELQVIDNTLLVWKPESA